MRNRHSNVAVAVILPAIPLFASLSTGQDVPAEKRPIEKTTQSSPMGMATGAAHAPRKDDKSRLITAGGFVDDAPIVFLDITKQAGLDKFHHRMGTPQKSTIIETNGSGAALLDYDNDGWLDIYLLNGSIAAAMAGKKMAPRTTLFLKKHDGSFSDATHTAGLRHQDYAVG